MDPTRNAYWSLFSEQKENQYRVAECSFKLRIRKLDALGKALEVTYRKRIQEALYKDFGKPVLETDVTEIYQVLSEIRLARNSLWNWMADQRVPTPLPLLGTSAWLRYEPKGVCLIISPWNFPVALTFGPLVSAIAAGNTVIIKPSEMTPGTASVMSEIVRDLFPANEVALVEGGPEVSKELLELPFNHIFFTGSTKIGKLVMKAAAEHLSSVTLELGGKSPTIVDETANLKQAAQRIVWGKFLNAGQICVAPDYVLVHEKRKDELVALMSKQIKAFFSSNASESSSYSRLVTQDHFDRLLALRDEAVLNGAQIVYGGGCDRKNKYMEPTLVVEVPEDARMMQEEIFGPILPIRSYATTSEVISYVSSRPKPLALYLYSRSKKNIREILRGTRSGSTAINTNILQYTNHHLPFGGSNASGNGKAHGIHGFREFSNQRSVIRQRFWSALTLVYPPYNHIKEKMAGWLIQWF